MKTIKHVGFTLVELMVVVAIIGILASIGIPSFLKYIRYSKAAEAEANVRKVSDGAKAYFVSEQRYSTAIDGSEPWHPSGGTPATAPGLPVEFDRYVFPGGDLATINTAEPECTGGGPDATGAPTQGQKKMPCLGVSPPMGSPQAAALHKLRVDFQDPLYFKYHFASENQGQTATATVTAISDFMLGGASHTLRQRLAISADQDVMITPAALTHELQ